MLNTKKVSIVKRKMQLKIYSKVFILDWEKINISVRSMAKSEL